MIRNGDYGGEMNTPPEIDDVTAETLLAGGSVATELEPLVRVVAAYREVARRPVPPRGELATRMVAGDFRDTGTHRRPRRERSAEPRRRRSVMLARVAARFAGIGLAVKAGAGVAVALASVGTAGVAGVLPEVVQDRFDTVVETVSGDQTPAPAPASDNAEFGQDVSEDAQDRGVDGEDGGVDGGQTSERARQQGDGSRPDQLPTPGPDESGEPPDEPPGKSGDRGRPANPGRPTDLPDPPGNGHGQPPSLPAPRDQ